MLLTNNRYFLGTQRNANALMSHCSCRFGGRFICLLRCQKSTSVGCVSTVALLLLSLRWGCVSSIRTPSTETATLCVSRSRSGVWYFSRNAIPAELCQNNRNRDQNHLERETYWQLATLLHFTMGIFERLLVSYIFTEP